MLLQFDRRVSSELATGKITFTGTVPPPKAFELRRYYDREYCAAISDGNGHRLLKEVNIGSDGGLRDVDRDDVIMVIPPSWAAPTALRIAKRRVPVTVDVAEAMSVSGFCHLVPGATVWDTWQRSTSGFAPLTEAVIGFPDGTTETADVVLVSRHVAGSGLRF